MGSTCLLEQLSQSSIGASVVGCIVGVLVLYMLSALCLYVVYSDLLRGLELKKDDLPSQMDQTKWVSNSVEWQVHAQGWRPGTT